jgi:hypothetical protein
MSHGQHLFNIPFNTSLRPFLTAPPPAPFPPTPWSRCAFPAVPAPSDKGRNSLLHSIPFPLALKSFLLVFGLFLPLVLELLDSRLTSLTTRSLFAATPLALLCTTVVVVGVRRIERAALVARCRRRPPCLTLHSRRRRRCQAHRARCACRPLPVADDKRSALEISEKVSVW